MSIFAISDLHLGKGVEKTMDKFGEVWNKHELKIKENWIRDIKEEDLVLIAGDISWAMSLEEAKQDLDFISNLPGKKVFIKGNHDYWWNSVSLLNRFHKDMFFLQNDIYIYGEYAICGTRGWLCPNDTKFNKQDEKVYRREQNRLVASLEKAKAKSMHNIIVMLHYPPTNDKLEMSEFIKIIKEYEVSKVVYGHLHANSWIDASLQGNHEDIEYILTSGDFLNFKPIKILE